MKTQLDSAWLAITYDCQNRCKWCYAASDTYSSERKNLPRDKIVPTLDLLKELGIKKTTLIGGEPTMYRHLPFLLEGHVKRDIKTGIVTNGRRLRDPNFSKMLKDSGVDSLTISIEGYDALSHDNLTQSKGSYKEAVEGIEVAAANGINVSTNTVICRSTYDKLERIADSLLDKPINYLAFNICGPCLTGEDNSEMIRPELAANIFEKIYRYVKSKGGSARLVTPTPLCFFEKDIRTELVNQRLIFGGPCQLATGNNFVLDYNGDVLPCTHMLGFPMGNIFTPEGVVSSNQFIEMYNSPEGIPFQFRQKLNRTASEKCDSPNCNQPCSGGCPLIWKVFNPDKEIKGMVN